MNDDQIAEKSNRLAWLAKDKSYLSITIIFITLLSAVVLIVIGLMLKVAEVNIWVWRGFVIGAGVLALATVVEYEFLS
ncbi:MAG: hypothetical protein K9W44_10630 [Candidatus Lokiarchaeota archaeon]|nr:hypothetical protein [Candidatus Harpocratesius repetitus]